MPIAPPWADNSSSPYPPSSPSSSDCDDELAARLRSSLAVLPESKLRALMLKLADSDLRFEHAIMKELLHSEAPSPSTPTPGRNRKRRRTKTRRNVKNLSISTDTSLGCQQALMMSQVDYVYHPGHLEEDTYEFISGFPQQTPHVVRTISMWTCCDEDEWSPGCVKA